MSSRDDYRVQCELRAGALSVTRLGQVMRGPHLGRRCILKTPREDSEHAQMARETIAREGRFLRALSHPLVVRALSADVDGPLPPFLALEYVEGVNLTTLVSQARTKGGLPSRVALALLVQLFEGLSYVHTASDEHGRALALRHCDITPSNLMVTWAGDLKLLDFGVSQWREDPSEFSRELSVGTPGYMAPEQVVGGPSTDRVDVFSAAVVGLVMLGARRSPFTRRNLQDTLRATALGERKKVVQILPRCPPPIAELFEDALDRVAARRPSASRFAIELLDRVHQTELRVATREEVQDFLQPLSELPDPCSMYEDALPEIPSQDVVLVEDPEPEVVTPPPSVSEASVLPQAVLAPRPRADPSRSLDELVDLGVEAVLGGDLSGALQFFTDAAAIDPGHRQVRTNLQRLRELGVGA